MIKNNLKFSSFSDGIIEVFFEITSADGGIPKPFLRLKETLRFNEKKVGIKRFYTALQNSIKVERVVQTQRRDTITTQDIVKINNRDTFYKIVQIQYSEEPTIQLMELSLEEVKLKHENV